MSGGRSVDNNTIDRKDKKVSYSPTAGIPTKTRLEEFDKANECISAFVSDPETGICYVKCVAGGKEIDVSNRYLVDDRVTIDDVTFTKNTDIARRWILGGKNVGIYTGLAPKDTDEDNAIILDIDLRDVGPDEAPGFMAPREVIDRVVGRTLTIETRSGGLQCIFRNALGAKGSPKLRYVDGDTGYLKDAGDTRIKHAYALFAGSYVAPDKITRRGASTDPLKPVKKPLPHADGLYRVIHNVPIIDLTQDLLDAAGLAIGGRRAPTRTRSVTTTSATGATVTRTVDAAKAYSSYGHRQFQYELTPERLADIAAHADPDYIRNRDGKTLNALSYTNQKIYRLTQTRTDYTTRGVTTDESESAENMALAYEMRKMGFDSPDIVAMAIILYQPRDKNFEIRSNGISYLADTVAGAFDRYAFEQGDGEFTEDEILAATNAGSEPVHTTVAQGRGYSHLYEVAQDDPNVRFEKWTEFPPFSPDAADITLWRGDPRAGKSWHGALYLSQHRTGNYITHRHEILDGIFSRLVDMTKDTTKTIVWLEGKHRCCPHKEGTGERMSCKTCPLRPAKDDSAGGIPFLEYQREASNILQKHRAICKALLLEQEVDYCPYYILKLAEPTADYCLTVAPFISPINNPDTYSIAPREYMVIDEEPTIDIFYPQYPALYEFQQYGFAEKWDVNHLIRNDIVGQFADIVGVIKDKNPQRVTTVNKVIRDICENIALVNTELVGFSKLQSKDNKEKDAIIRRLIPKLKTFGDRSLEFKQQIMVTFMEHLQDLPYPTSGDPIQYLQPFLFPARNLVTWQQGSHPNSPKQILYLMSDHTPMFKPDFTKMLVIGATEAEVFVDQIRGTRSVCRVDLELFPYGENYLLVVAAAEKPAQQDRIVNQVMARLLERNTMALKQEKPVVPFVAVTATKDKQQALISTMAPHGKVIGLGEFETRADVVRYYEQGYPVAFYNNGTIARGVDLPEYDILFFMDGGFATPRFSALEAVAVALSDEPSIKRYRNLRVSKIADECTNSAYRTAPLYTRKADRAKILVIAHHNLEKIYQSLYKDSILIPVEIDSIDRCVTMLANTSSKIERKALISDCGSHTGTIHRQMVIGTHGSTSAPHDAEYCNLGEHILGSQNIHDTIYYHEIIEDSIMYSVRSGSSVTTMREMAAGLTIAICFPTRDRKTQKTYDLVVRAVLGLLRGRRPTQRVSIQPIVDKVNTYKSLKSRKVNKKTIENVIEEMILEGILLCEETEDFRVLPDGADVPIKRWIRINPNSPVASDIDARGKWEC